jgi:signal transduction histidine kinase
MARILAEGTGARVAVVWLRIGNELLPQVAWPREAELPPARTLTEKAEVTDHSAFLPVAHHGEVLGALSIAKAPGDPLRPAEEGLVRDLASGAGLVLRNVRLIEELKASRIRLVKAQDEERRRLERDIHDGAQQQLVALQVKLGLARSLLSTDAQRTEQLLESLQAETQAALEDLRDLARGIYPPLLADQGLPAALGAQAAKAPLPVEVHADSVGRYPPEAEAAVYFSVLEALQNTAKYAHASRATVMLSSEDGTLSFEVSDDGVGFDPGTTTYGTGLQGMADRLEALGGSLWVRSTPGGGTSVAGRVHTRLLEVPR